MNKIILFLFSLFLFSCNYNSNGIKYLNSENNFLLKSTKNQYLKDPSVIKISENSFLLVYENLKGKRGINILPFNYSYDKKNKKDLIKIGKQIPLKIKKPKNLNANFVRWAPKLILKNTGKKTFKLYLYYSMGEQKPNVSAPDYGINWPTFRIYVSSIEISKSKSITEQLKSKVFSNEKMLFDINSFINPKDKTRWTNDYGIIDPDIFIDSDKQIYVYYTVVLYGRPKLRYHEEFIRSRKLKDFETDGDGVENEIYNGFKGIPDDGVAEASKTFKIKNNYIILISSNPTTNQKIIALKSKNVNFTKAKFYEFYKGDKTRSEFFGVGQPDIFKIKRPFLKEDIFMIYQGYSGIDYKFKIIKITKMLKTLRGKQ